VIGNFRAFFQDWDRTLASLFIVSLSVPLFLYARDGQAGFSSQFSLSVGEEYNDNVFFSRQKEHDFVTFFVPAITLLYSPPGQTISTFRANLGVPAQIFPRHAELNNFGENSYLTAAYTYFHSPRLTFHLSDSLRRLGEARTTAISAVGPSSRPMPTTTLPPAGGAVPRPVSSEVSDLISRGDQVANFISLQGLYLYSPEISVTGNYSTAYTAFLDEGGNDVSHSIGIRGVYNWRQEHNFHIGYTINIITSRDGSRNVVHNYDIGDDYFSTYRIQLDPTLTLAASVGISVNTGRNGPRLANNLNLTLTQIWETATLTAGIRRGLTASGGVAGVSDTTSFNAAVNLRFTPYLTGFTGVDYSLFDTDTSDFNIFQAHGGLQYLITSWLSSALTYTHRWRDAGRGAEATGLLSRGKVASNSVYLVFTTRFDIWPNVGLFRGQAPGLPTLPSPASVSP
jgi:hypothetical protein